MSIHIHKDGTGYFKGDKVIVTGYEKGETMVEFQYIEGHRTGELIYQPLESCFNAETLAPIAEPCTD